MHKLTHMYINNCVLYSLSLARTHTHTHTHTLSLYLSLSLSLIQHRSVQWGHRPTEFSLYYLRIRHTLVLSCRPSLTSQDCPLKAGGCCPALLVYIDSIQCVYCMIVLTLFSIIEGCGLMGGVALSAFWIIAKRLKRAPVAAVSKRL